jgi:hypothetical protein
MNGDDVERVACPASSSFIYGYGAPMGTRSSWEVHDVGGAQPSGTTRFMILKLATDGLHRQQEREWGCVV